MRFTYSAASDLGLHCLPITPLRVPRLQWVNKYFQNPGHTLLPIFTSFRPMGMVGEVCLPSNAYYPRTPFILGSISVGLNILIRHSFTDL